MKAFYNMEEKRDLILASFFFLLLRHVHTNPLPLLWKELFRPLPQGTEQLFLASRQVKRQAACHTVTGSFLGKENQSISAGEITILISSLPPRLSSQLQLSGSSTSRMTYVTIGERERSFNKHVYKCLETFQCLYIHTYSFLIYNTVFIEVAP